MHLCVVIPALNEEPTIGRVLEQIQALVLPAALDGVSTVVVDDGSTDGTSRIAREKGAVVVRHARNYGVGRAFQSGLECALGLGADLIVNIDGDGQFDGADIPQLLEPILRGEADFVTASRFKDPTLVPQMPPVKLWGNHQMSRLVSFLVGQRFHDVSCGFRAYSRETALRLNLWGEFTYTQESFLDLCFKGMRVVEVPVRVRGTREFGQSRVARSLWVYARRTSSIIFHAYRDYWPMQFFGVLGLIIACPGLVLLAFLFTNFFVTGRFHPHVWAGFVGGSFIGLGIVCLLVGLLGSILRRMRLNQEEILYLLRRAALDGDHRLHRSAATTGDGTAGAGDTPLQKP